VLKLFLDRLSTDSLPAVTARAIDAGR
jgi:hypothetical protein